MREHTITVMRQMLSNQDSAMLSDLKEKQKHEFRTLNEVRAPRIPFFQASEQMRARQVERAAKKAGITNAKAIEALANELSTNPKALLTWGYWSKIGRGLASAIAHGKFDPSYRIPEKHGTFSKTASSLERVGGPIATGVYKAGRALQRAEGWFTPWDPDVGSGLPGSQRREYTRGSAFDPAQERGRRDDCISRRVKTPRGYKTVGYKMGTPEYERCMDGEMHPDGDQEQAEAERLRELKRVLSSKRVSDRIPDFVNELGVDPDVFFQRQRADMDIRGMDWRRMAQAIRSRSM